MHLPHRASLLLAAAAVTAGSLASPMCGTALASPNLPTDDPRWLDTLRLQWLGLVPPFTGGFLPFSEARAQRLRLEAGPPPDPTLPPVAFSGAWARLRRVSLRLSAFEDTLRPFSTEVHPRYIGGGLSVSCDNQEGRPCGDGAGSSLELDAAAGLGPWISAFTRVRLTAGTGQLDPDAELDRAYVSAEWGPWELEIGRDVLAVGPSPRSQIVWSLNPPPLDHIRLTIRPFAVIEEKPRVLRASATWFVGRLRSPQRFEGTLVDVARIHLDVAEVVSCGANNIVHLGGEGAPGFSVSDWFVEHFWRKNSPTPLGIANHRFGFDCSVALPAPVPARLYYALTLEDWRRNGMHALRRDTDHLVGLQLTGLGPRRAHDLLVELQRSGVRSQEHELFTEGFTSGGRAGGTYLGPDAWSVYVGARVLAGRALVWPWLEWLRSSSDFYMFSPEAGEIWFDRDGIEELRYRAGARVLVPLLDGLRLDGQALFEHVVDAGFVQGATRENYGADLLLTWEPSWDGPVTLR